MSPNNWLVYVIFRSDGVPLYVGIGKVRVGAKQRYHDHGANSKNRYLSKMFRENPDLPVEVVMGDLTREEANLIEASLISAIGRADKKQGSLANLTDGGDGCPGYVESKEQRLIRAQKIRRGLTPAVVAARALLIKAALARPDVKARQSAGIKAAFTRPGMRENHAKQVRLALARPEVKARHKAAIKAALNTPEARALRSIISQAMWDALSPEERKERQAKTAVANIGKTRTPEQRNNISVGTRNAMANLSEDTKERMRLSSSRPETRVKMSEAAKARLSTPEAKAISVARLNTPEAVAKRYTPERNAKISSLIWITDGANNARIQSAQEIPEGWRRGRAFSRYRAATT